MDDLTEQIRSELAAIEPVVSELLGLESRWNGEVELTDDPQIHGVKYYRCSIGIDRVLAEKPERWRTLIHELIHAHSAGVTAFALSRYRGWEEGPVEAYQRLIRLQVLAAVGVAIEEEVLQRAEASHPLEHYIADVESLRRALGAAEDDAEAFYRELLRIPLPDRVGWGFGKGRESVGNARFVAIFSPINRRLCEESRRPA